MKEKFRRPFVRHARVSLLLCGTLCQALAPIAGARSVISIAELLSPVEILDSVECRTPAGVDFKSAGSARYSLSGVVARDTVAVTLRPEAGVWDILAYSYFRVDITNRGRGLVWIRGRLDNEAAEDWRNSTASMAYILPGERATLGFPFPRANELNDAPAIFDRQNGKPNGHRSHWKAFDPSAVTGCRLVIRTTTGGALDLDDIQISLAQPYGVEANPELMQLPYLDAFGQVRQLDWTGKLNASGELLERAEAEARQRSALGVPAAFNQYGGWAEGPQLEATGRFRVEKYRDRWWLVDPSGRLFFSQGANSVGFGQRTPLAGREALFEWHHAEEGRFKEAVVGERGLQFIVANVIRTFGADWREQGYRRIHDRMRSWGLNTVGAWSDAELVEDRRTPYTTILHLGHGYSPLGKGISDPFSDNFKEALRRGLTAKLEAGHQNEWHLGVFIDNEIDWNEDFVDNALSGRPDQPARRAVIADLKDHYTRVEGLNAAWGTELTDWEDLKGIPEARNAAILQDTARLRGLIAGEYYRRCQLAMREILPGTLYLGSRIHKAPPEVMEAAIRFADVLSLNVYAPLASQGLRQDIDKACLITEFHFAAPDRGVPGVGLSPVGDQVQRSRSYLAYTLDAVLDPNIVGTHWFAYTDQSAAGRPGENYQIGFVDVTDTPYTEITSMSRLLAEKMYSLAETQPKSDRLELLEDWLEAQ